MTDMELQCEELVALSSIYEGQGIFNHYEIIRQDVYVNVGQISIPVDLSSKVQIINLPDVIKETFVEYLPPVILRFELPVGYPSKCSPKYYLSCLWLTKTEIDELNNALNTVWSDNKGMPVLFTWVQTVQDIVQALKSAEPFVDLAALAYLPSTSQSFDSPISSSDSQKLSESLPKAPVKNFADIYTQLGQSLQVVYVTPAGHTVQRLHELLVEFDNMEQRKKFDAAMFECSVCLATNFGRDCVKFNPCAHVFCKECIREYFTLKIKEGDAKNGLKCLADKCATEPTCEQVLSVVGEDLYARYDRLRLNHTLDLMQDIVICPRPSCQIPVLMDAVTDNLAHCSRCHFAFCHLCRKAYHGVAPCSMSAFDRDKIADEYRSSVGEQRLQLEQRFGRKQLQQIVDDTLAKRWVKENSKQCPHCRVHIEKNEGCNKMVCSKCGSQFCWLCMKLCDFKNPYTHFNNPQSACYNMLFHGTVFDEDAFDWQWNRG